MNNDLVTQDSGGYLAMTDDDYLSKLTGVAEGLKGGGAFAYMKFDGNSGKYSYGADDVELNPGVQLVLDWKSFRQGWIIWVGGQVADELMVNPVTERVPTRATLPDHGPYGKDDGPREQNTVTFKLLEEPFIEMVFQANNKSKLNALGALMKDAVAKLKAHPGQYPIIEIDSNSFDAKDPDNPKRKFKKYAPKFKIVDWISADELNAMAEGNPEDYAENGADEGQVPEQAALPAPEPEPVVEPTPAPQPQQTRPASAPRPAPVQRPAAVAPNATKPAAAGPAAPAAGRRGRF